MNYSRVEKYRNQKSKKLKKGLATALMGTVLVSPIALSSISASASSVPTGTQATQTEWTANSVETVRSEMQAQGLNLNDVNGDYVVRQGDTLSAISIAANESMAQIAQDNHITNLDMIYVGQILHLRHTGSATDSTMISNATHANVAGNGTKVALPSRTAEQVKANAMVNQGIMPNATASSIATPAGHATADKASDKAGNQAAKNDGSNAKADNKSNNKADNKTNGTHATANNSSQAANHGSHASSAPSASSVNSGKHDQAAASSSAQPATSNSQASSSKPASSTANKPADKPATSGSQASSSQTGSSSQSTPAQGSSSTTPSQNGSSTAPSQGSSSQTPSQGSSSTTPSQSGNTTTPSQGSSSTTPSQGSSSQTPDYNDGVVNADGTVNYQAAMNQQGPWDGQSSTPGSASNDFYDSAAEQSWEQNHPGVQMTNQGYSDGSNSRTPVYSGQDTHENAARLQMSQQQLDDTNAAMQKNVDASQTFGNGIQWVSSDYQGEVAGTQKITVDNPVNTPYENYTDHAGQIDANVVKQAYSGTSPYGVTATTPDGAHYVSSTITNAGQTGGADGLSANNVNLTFYK